MEYSQGGSNRRQPDTRRPNTRTGSASYGSYASERKRRRSMRYVTQYDFALLFLTIGIALFGVLMIYSAGYYTASLRGDPLFYVKSQVKGLFLGFLVMILVSRLDYQVLMHKIGFLHSSLSQISLIFAYILQIMVLFVGVERNGAKRWLDLKVIQFQPSEISKIATILFLAYAIYKNRRALDNKWGIGALRLLVYIGPLIIIILKENMSSAIIVSGIVVGMCFVGSRKKLYFAVCLVLLICGGACYIFLGEGFRAERIDIWLHVETNENAHQIKQGLYAIATGGVFGKGLGNSMQKLGYIPEAYNDMIFAVICEELGIVGAAGLIIAFLVMFWRITWIAIKATDLFGTMICVGVLIQLAIQVVINVAVVTNSIPSTGIPLPLISYGGTSATIMMAEMGLVLSVSAGSK